MAEGGADVLALPLEHVQRGQLAGAAQQRVGGTGEFAEVYEVCALRFGADARFVEAFPGVLGDGLQESVAHRARAVLVRRGGHDKGLVDERAERFERDGPAHRFGGGEVAAAREDGQPSQDVPFVRVEQVPGPVDDGAQGLLAGQDGTAAGGEQPETVVEPVGDLPQRQHPQPGGGQFDGERQPVEPSADLGGGLRIVLDAEPGPGGCPAVGEQP